jgi:trk system potassium uptake protein
VAVTGDDEDNIVICQLAKERYGVAKVVARVNDPRNQAHFELLGIGPTVSATEMVMALVQHEMPQHELVHLVNLSHENLEIVEVEVAVGSPAAGKRVEQLRLPETARLISVVREGNAEIAVGSTELRAGDQVLAILEPGKEQELRRVLLKGSKGT